MPDRPEFGFGPYLVRVSEDVLCVQANGPMSEEVARSIMQLAQQIKDRHQYYFLLGDLRNASTVHPDARRLLVKFGVEHPPAGVALFGSGGILARTTTALLIGALKLLSKQRPNWMQFEREEDASAWIEKERQRVDPATK